MTKEQYDKLIGTHKVELSIGLNCNNVIEIEIDEDTININMSFDEARDIIYDIAYEQALEFFEIGLDIFSEE